MIALPLFLSIIIPVYKVEPYLRECLESIAKSSQDCWEAIIVDDGSPDGCPLICDEYAARDKRFRVIHQQNAGVAVARNAGLDVAQGEWVWFVDSDDYVDMEPVGEMIERLKAHDSTDLVMFDMERFQDGEEVTKCNQSLVAVDEHLSKNDFLVKYVCFHHQCLWYHRRVWGNVRFTCGLRLAEDLEFQYKCLTLCHRPVKVNLTLYYYRLRETSATGDTTYRARAVEDLPVVLTNLAIWSHENSVKAEPWLNYRIMKLLQNLLYSASLVPQLSMKDFQKTVRNIVAAYKALNFSFVKTLKIGLAEWNVKAYFLFNRVYLKFKGIS